MSRRYETTSYFTGMTYDDLLEIERSAQAQYDLWHSPEASEVHGVLRAKMMRSQTKDNLAAAKEALDNYRE